MQRVAKRDRFSRFKILSIQEVSTTRFVGERTFQLQYSIFLQLS